MLQILAPGKLVLIAGLTALVLQNAVVQCQQYVPSSFLKNPPTDATAIKSWTFLKESMERMGDQAADLLTIRQDVGSMQEDLDTQVNVWNQAKVELLQENAGLTSEVKHLNMQVASGSTVQVEVLKAQQEQQMVANQVRDVKVAAVQQENSFAAERMSYQKRIHELTERFHAAQAAAATEASTEGVDHTKLHDDGLVLQSKATELKNKMKDVNASIAVEKETADQKTSDLEALHVELTSSIQKLKQGVEEAGPLEKNMITMQAQLKDDTAEMITARQQYSAVSMECKKKKAELTKVLAEEQAALSRVQEETTRFCGPVEAKHEVYTQELAQCQSTAGQSQ